MSLFVKGKPIKNNSNSNKSIFIIYTNENRKKKTISLFNLIKFFRNRHNSDSCTVKMYQEEIVAT